MLGKEIQQTTFFETVSYYFQKKKRFDISFKLCA